MNFVTLRDRLLREMHAICHAAGLERQEPCSGINELLEDLVRHLGCDLLDLHAAFFRTHHDDAARLAVNDERKVILLRNVGTRFNEQTVHLFALRPRLMRDERLAEKFLCGCAHLVLRMGNLDTASLAAATRMDLCLDDYDVRAELRCLLYRLIDRKGRLAFRDIDAVRTQDCLALILMDIHKSIRPLFVWVERPLLFLQLSRNNYRLYCKTNRYMHIIS